MSNRSLLVFGMVCVVIAAGLLALSFKNEWEIKQLKEELKLCDECVPVTTPSTLGPTHASVPAPSETLMSQVPTEINTQLSEAEPTPIPVPYPPTAPTQAAK